MFVCPEITNSNTLGGPYYYTLRAFITGLPWSVLVAGFQFSGEMMGRQTCPFSSTLGWYILVWNRICCGVMATVTITMSWIAYLRRSEGIFSWKCYFYLEGCFVKGSQFLQTIHHNMLQKQVIKQTWVTILCHIWLVAVKQKHGITKLIMLLKTWKEFWP